MIFWGADPDYKHDKIAVNDSLVLHFFYQVNDETTIPTWTRLAKDTKKLFKFASKNFGQYPYKQYSILQGGDGGMEDPRHFNYRKRSYASLRGVVIHEVMHTWYQMMMATNESLYPWMDEGFTTYASDQAAVFFIRGELSTLRDGKYRSYYYLIKSEWKSLYLHMLITLKVMLLTVLHLILKGLFSFIN